MPRIAVAVMVVVTIGVCIGVNITRFPVVWDMVSHPQKRAAPRIPLAAPAAPASRSREVVDLREYAPPTIHASSGPGATSPITEPAATEPSASQGADVQSSPASSSGGGAMHLISGPTTQADPTADAAPATGPATNDPMSPPSLASDPAAPGLLPADATIQDAVAEIAPPIRFGPATAAPMQSLLSGPGSGPLNVGNATRGTGPAPADNGEATTWPAQLAPTLKLGAKPLIAEDEPGQWREDQELTPIRRPNQARAGDASSRDTASRMVERLPRVLRSDSTTPWSDYDRRPEISKALYPTTGR